MKAEQSGVLLSIISTAKVPPIKSFLLFVTIWSDQRKDIFAGTSPKSTEPSAAKQVAGVIVGVMASGPLIFDTAKVTVVKQSSAPTSAIVMV